jgi:hypothetical protein
MGSYIYKTVSHDNDKFKRRKKGVIGKLKKAARCGT